MGTREELGPIRLRDAIGAWIGLGALLLGVVPLLLPKLLGGAPSPWSWLPGVGGAWLVIGAALVTVRRPAVAPALEGLVVGWALGLGLSLGAFVLLLAVMCVVPITGALMVPLMLVLLALGGGCIVIAGSFGLVWLFFAAELAALPRAERSQELARIAHLAAPALVVVLLGTTASAGSLPATDLVLVPAPLAVALTLSALVVGLAVWLRQRRPLAPGHPG